jgi:hypothetical protein
MAAQEKESPSNDARPRPQQHSRLKEEATKLPKELRNIVAGGLAGMAAKSVVAPLERIKILYQVTAEKFVLRQLHVVALNIIRKEGFTALWRGNTATMLRVFPYAGIQFMVFDRCKTYLLGQHAQRDRVVLTRRDTREDIKHFGLSPLEGLICGMIAGAISVMCTYPLDLTRAQLALYKTHRHSKNIGFIKVLQHNFQLGVRAKWDSRVSQCSPILDRDLTYCIFLCLIVNLKGNSRSVSWTHPNDTRYLAVFRNRLFLE